MYSTTLGRALLVLATSTTRIYAQPAQNADALGFVPVPENGVASTTEFPLGSEFPVNGRNPTSCGVTGLPNNAQISTADENHTPNAPDSVQSRAGKGPGFLYAAINELGYGSNAGTGPACGVCYNLTPMDASGKPVPDTNLTFMIVDSCPQTLTDGTPNPPCSQCKIGDKNDNGQNFHFDVATDAMNTDQFNRFYQIGKPGQSDGNYKAVQFQKVPCDSSVNVIPPVNTANNGCVTADTCKAQSTNRVCTPPKKN